MRSSIVAFTAGFVATTSAFSCNGNYFSFFNRDGNALTYQRLDPALFPGTEGTHLHSFDGGNGLSATTSFEETQASTCTTARIKTDKSLYWRPSLFFNGNGTGFYRVPEKSSKIYYKFGDGDKYANVTGFPENFNMMAGTPSKRSDGDNPAGVRWGCHEPDGGSTAIFANGFPKGFSSCNYGFASEVTFPSCWNGQKLDPENPDAHMAYPNGVSGVGIENCPTTHRAARFPTVFIEFWYDISSFNGQYGPNDAPWVLSNGDPTGFGFHGDFLNGWEKGILEKATAETGGCNCGCGCGQEEMKQCFGAENVNDDSDPAWASCSAPVAYGSNDAATVLKALPGCNPIQSGPAAATTATGPGCTAAAAAGGIKVSASSAVAAIKTPIADVLSAASSVVSSLVASVALPAATTPASMSSHSHNHHKSKASSSSHAFADAASALPSMALSILHKEADTPTGGYEAVKPTPTAATPEDATKPSPAASSQYDAPADDLPPMSLASTAVPADATGSPSSGDTEDCKAPVYVTVTPTVYITKNVADATSCGAGTIYKTLTETATITVGAMSSGAY
ncbi:hypothetical protein EJ02DRAFT_442737 [Clathrospora elynae]|uniref:DUF1996 domain-containing protein n=1 Tax=Clathrospora elynae TaxID=706981 RepID=A0A6A5SWE7_9PLEO|nr:hypothetical protein EJ02DRAFT_442737 [Clathrospora elynae]